MDNRSFRPGSLAPCFRTRNIIKKRACFGLSRLTTRVKAGSLRKHPFLLALRHWRRFARNVPSGEERGETDVFSGEKAGYAPDSYVFHSRNP